MVGTAIWTHPSMHVCVFSCWYNFMKTILSLALGHSSDTNQSKRCDEKFLPLLRLCDISCGRWWLRLWAVNTEGLFLSLLWSVGCRFNKMFCHLVAREKFITFSVHNTPATYYHTKGRRYKTSLPVVNFCSTFQLCWCRRRSAGSNNKAPFVTPRLMHVSDLITCSRLCSCTETFIISVKLTLTYMVFWTIKWCIDWYSSLALFCYMLPSLILIH